MTIQQALLYLNSGIQEGYFDPEQFEGMSEDQLIAFAEYMGAKGDFLAQAKEEE